jgi:formate-dependent phosphoribosylglycinamide formyltransferase (GAR transformylase)
MKAILAKLALGALLLLALAAVAASCGKGKGVLTTTNTLVSAHHSAAQESSVHKAKSLDDVLGELNALEKPLS